MPAPVWISLAFFVVALAAGVIWAGANARRAVKRGLPALQRMRRASESLNGRSRELDRRLTTLQPKVAHLQRDRARLARGLAQARVLLDAVQEIRTAYRVARFLGP